MGLGFWVVVEDMVHFYQPSGFEPVLVETLSWNTHTGVGGVWDKMVRYVSAALLLFFFQKPNLERALMSKPLSA